MAAVLLRMAGLDAFDADAQAQPPDRELAQIKQGVGGSERHTVVAADVGGQATFLKKPFKYSKSYLPWWKKEPHSRADNGWHDR